MLKSILAVTLVIMLICEAAPLSYAGYTQLNYQPYDDPNYAIKRPLLVAAQGIVESNMNPFAKGLAKEKGAFQVIETIWGKVSKDSYKQIKQNEKIMDELLKAVGGDTMEAVQRYNGSGEAASVYAKKVRRLALEMTLWQS